MYPTLTDLIRDIFGVEIPLPIQTYGFFVALAFLTAGFILYLELKRKEREGIIKPFTKKVITGAPAKPAELFFSALIGFIIGFKVIEAITDYSDLVANPQEFILSARGNWIGGIVFGVGSAAWTWWEKHKKKLDKPRIVEKEIHPYEQSGNMLLVAAVFGLLGTKIFHHLEHIDELIKNPIDAIFSFSGLSFLGGLILGGIAVVVYARRNNVKPLYFVDSAAPAAALGYAIGRIGCQVSGDGCWGVVNLRPKPDWLSFLPDWMWAYNYPHNVINQGEMLQDCAGNHCHILAQPVFPTPFYETVIMAIVFIILWSLRKRLKTPGMLFSIYLIFAGFERFFIEKIRVNPPYHIFGLELTQAEIISFVMVLGGIVGILLLQRNKKTLHQY